MKSLHQPSNRALLNEIMENPFLTQKSKSKDAFNKVDGKPNIFHQKLASESSSKSNLTKNTSQTTLVLKKEKITMFRPNLNKIGLDGAKMS
jgi:hypothetical protein